MGTNKIRQEVINRFGPHTTPVNKNNKTTGLQSIIDEGGLYGSGASPAIRYYDSTGQSISKKRWNKVYPPLIKKDGLLIAINNMANGRFGNYGGYDVNAYGTGRGANGGLKVASYTNQSKPIGVGIPQDLQNIFNHSPYLTQAQKNDMVSIWTSSPKQGNQENVIMRDGVARYTKPIGYQDVPLKSATKSLLNPKPTSAMSKIFGGVASQGNTAALALENKNYIKALNPSHYEMATQNATGRNFTPESVTQYENKVAGEDKVTEKDFWKVTNVIDQLKNPETQSAYIEEAMKGSLEASMKELGGRYGYNYEKDYANLTKLISNNNKFTQTMSTLFQNSLGLQYNMPDEVMNELIREAHPNDTAAELKGLEAIKPYETPVNKPKVEPKVETNPAATIKYPSKADVSHPNSYIVRGRTLEAPKTVKKNPPDALIKYPTAKKDYYDVKGHKLEAPKTVKKNPPNATIKYPTKTKPYYVVRGRKLEAPKRAVKPEGKAYETPHYTVSHSTKPVKKTPYESPHYEVSHSQTKKEKEKKGGLAKIIRDITHKVLTNKAKKELKRESAPITRAYSRTKFGRLEERERSRYNNEKERRRRK